MARVYFDSFQQYRQILRTYARRRIGLIPIPDISVSNFNYRPKLVVNVIYENQRDTERPNDSGENYFYRVPTPEQKKNA